MTQMALNGRMRREVILAFKKSGEDRTCQPHAVESRPFLDAATSELPVPVNLSP